MTSARRRPIGPPSEITTGISAPRRPSVLGAAMRAAGGTLLDPAFSSSDDDTIDSEQVSPMQSPEEHEEFSETLRALLESQRGSMKGF